MPYSKMVALGSSFAAGPGITPVVDRRAMRSGRNYAHLVAAALGAELVDATVSGATTENVLELPQRSRGHLFPPQIESVGPDSDLVTVTAGGNDLGYLGTVMTTGIVERLKSSQLTYAIGRRLGARSPLRPVTEEEVDVATDGLVRIVEVIRERAPDARVILADYLPILTQESKRGPTLRFTDDEIEHIRRLGQQLSAAFMEASRRTGADVIPSSAYNQSHGLGSSDPWITPLRLTKMSSSFHPTASGMQEVARSILRLLAAHDVTAHEVSARDET